MKTRNQILSKIIKLEKYAKVHEKSESEADHTHAREARRQILLLEWVLK